MKNIKLVLVVALLAVAGVVMPAQAQFRFGLKAGVAVNSLSFDSKMLNADNRAGFTGGAMVEFSAPLTGLGVDLSVMYVRRNAQWMESNQVKNDNRDYIDIPINFKWRISIPLINKVFRPFITTGPSFSFLTSKKMLNNVVENRNFDTAWNFGAGVELFNKVQLAASYGLGMTGALKWTGVTGESGIEGKNRYWTITAAYMF
ncbi:MAG: PorT family protein [Paramuribaculum sp.]|nr:PorT family protein [Paramuribaculum sp.]